MLVKGLVSLLKEKYGKIKYRNNLPNDIYNSDLFLVEFPKSGITWLSTILANIYMLSSKSGISPTYFNLEQIIADVHHSKSIPVPNNFPYFRTIKSHATYTPHYRNVVYLLRNPFSVMESYYSYLSSQNYFDGTFDEFVQSPIYGVAAWREHVESWVRPKRELNIHLIKYEDLRSNAHDTVHDLCANLGFVLDESSVETAISRSDFDSMRISDDLFRQYSPSREYNFVRKGSTSSQREMSSSIRRIIQKECHGLLKRFYPEMADG